MATLRFGIETVRALVAHAKSCKEHQATYGAEPEAGLLLVGDQGVYLMSTGLPRLLAVAGQPISVVAYAVGCDPKKDEDFYERKREVFGGDDGVNLLPLAGVEGWLAAHGPDATHVSMRLTTRSMALLAPAPPKKRKSRAKV